jgi:hypothetical protein
MLKLIIAAAIGIFCCACDTGEEFDLEKQFDIKYDETITNDSDKLKIKFDDVVNDSRCPKEAKCVWAGNAEVKFTLTSESDSGPIILNTNIKPKDHKVFGYSIALKRLAPSKSVATSLKKKDYVATLVISKSK